MINVADLEFKTMKRTRKVNGERVIQLDVFPTESNRQYFDLVVEEAILTFGDDEYVIKKLNEKSIGKTYYKQVTAIHKFYVDLINKQQPRIHNGSITFREYMNLVFENTPYSNFDVEDHFPARQFENLGNENRLALLQKGLDRFRAEMVILPRSYKPIFQVEIGEESDFQFRYGHNIKAISQEIDTTNLATKIAGTGDPELDIKASYTSPNIAIFGEIDAPPVNDERFKSNSALLEEMKARLIDEPEVSLTLDFVDLRAAGYPHEEPREGNKVWLIYEPMNDLLIETRILEINETFNKDLKVIKSDVTLSNYKKTFAGTMFDNINKQLSDLESNQNKKIQKAIVSADGKNTNYSGANEPIPPESGFKKDDLWFKVVDGEYSRTYRFDGSDWVIKMDMDDKEAKEEAEEARARADKAFEGVENLTTVTESIGLRVGGLESRNLISHDPNMWESVFVFHSLQDDVQAIPGEEYTITSYGDYIVTVSHFDENSEIITAHSAHNSSTTFTADNNVDHFVVYIQLDDANFADNIGDSIRVQLEKGNKSSSWTPNNIYSQYSQLDDAINFRVVQKGDVIGQINIEAGTSLVQNKKLVLDAETTFVTRDFKIDGSANIKDATIGTAQIGEIDAAHASIINLNVRDLVGNFASFVSDGFNDIGSQVSISSAGLTTYSGGLRNSLLNGLGHRFYHRGSDIGKIGTNNWTGDNNYRGLVFDIENQTDYMAWAHQRNSTDTIYSTLFSWHRTSTKAYKGFTFSDNVKFEYAVNFDGRGHIKSFSNAIEWGVRGSNYNITQFDSGQVQFHMGSSTARHIFFEDGTKKGGSIDIDNEVLGMSPVDSPQVLIEYIEFDICLSESGVKVYLDESYTKAVSDFAVFTNNGVVTEKGDNYFIISGEGKADARIVGKRVEYELAFWGNMDSPEKKNEEKLSTMNTMSVLSNKINDLTKNNWYVERPRTRIQL